MSQDRAAEIAELEDRLDDLDQIPISIAQRGYEAWAAKPHNKGWVRRIRGTPIPNDVVVCIAEAFGDALVAAREEGRRAGIEEAATWLDDDPCGDAYYADAIRSLADKEPT